MRIIRLTGRRISSRRLSARRWLAAVLVVAFVGIGTVAVLGVRAANSPYDDAATAKLRANAVIARGYEHLRKVKANANHPCHGLFEVTDAKYRDGEPICTHGPDLAQKPEADEAGLGTTGFYTYNPQQEVNFKCYGTGTDGRRVQIIYAWNPTYGNNFAEAQNLIRGLAARIDGTLAAAGGPALHVRYQQSSSTCQPTVDSFQVKVTADMLDFGKLVSELQAAGYTRADRKYLVYIDQPDTVSSPFSGQGTVYQDSSPASTNQNNNKVGYALLYLRSEWDYAEAHELFHNLGAVQLDAPNTSGGFHCLDGFDLMCYADNANTNGVGVNGKPYSSSRCPAFAHQFVPDCGSDDYYSTVAVQNYLATHWNVAHSGWLAP